MNLKPYISHVELEIVLAIGTFVALKCLSPALTNMLRMGRSLTTSSYDTAPPTPTTSVPPSLGKHPPGTMQIKKISLTSKKNWWMG